ncbi:ThuA domain-containing protein [Paenibacillus sambharensis]|nr:ThuA domain-containing protein [Paenibacillus sambharensis]
MRKRIIAVLGDHWHDPAVSGEALRLAVREAEPLLQTAIEIEIVPAEQLASRLSDNPDAVVMYKEDRINPLDEAVRTWMTPETAEAITDYVRGGGSWLAWHSGMAGYDPEGEYVRMLRGYFEHHPDMKMVTYIEADSPQQADSGKVLAELWDEHYFVWCDAQATKVWLVAVSADGRSEAGWRHGYGQGKVSCLTPAHPKESLADPAFIRLLAGELAGLLRDQLRD